MSSKVFKLQVCGGLGSRLRVAVAGFAYCRATGRELVLNWPRKEPSETHAGGAFKCRFSDLYVADCREVGWDHEAWTGGVKDPCILGVEKSPIRLRADKIDGFQKYLDDFDYMHAFDSFGMTKDLRALVRNTDPLFAHGVPIIGVHIRDTLKASECAEYGWYLDELDEIEKMMDPRKFKIWLSCDSGYIEERMRTFWGDRISLFHRDYNYDRVGIMKQCADAHVLKRCSWVIGSNHSSFSQHVALIRGAKYQTDSNNARHVTGGNYHDMTVPKCQAAIENVLLADRDEWS